MRIHSLAAILAIKIYQLALSRTLQRKGVKCLHYPSCSQYGIEVYRKYGFIKASMVTWRRFHDCNPFSGRPYIDYP